MEILPFLYLGSAYHASRQDYLSDLHITALLNVSRRDLQPAKGHYDYKWIPVEDSHMADISSHFQEAIEFIGELRGMNVVSVSPSLGDTSLTIFWFPGFAYKGLCQEGIFLVC